MLFRSAAGQAHWQNGVCERHGGSWKAIYAKLLEENLILEEEFTEACAAVSDAKNPRTHCGTDQGSPQDNGYLAPMVVKLGISLMALTTRRPFQLEAPMPNLPELRSSGPGPGLLSFSVKPKMLCSGPSITNLVNNQNTMRLETWYTSTVNTDKEKARNLLLLGWVPLW